jgi:hypothetical protein
MVWFRTASLPALLSNTVKSFVPGRGGQSQQYHGRGAAEHLESGAVRDVNTQRRQLTVRICTASHTVCSGGPDARMHGSLLCGDPHFVGPPDRSPISKPWEKVVDARLNLPTARERALPPRVRSRGTGPHAAHGRTTLWFAQSRTTLRRPSGAAQIRVNHLRYSRRLRLSSISPAV